MLHHKFSVGQTVHFVPGASDANIPRGNYRVQRLLPSETRDLQYRVKHAQDGHERVLSESQLEARDAIAGSAAGPRQEPRVPGTYSDPRRSR